MIETIVNYLQEDYNVFITLLALILLIWGVYQKIKFLCLEKASEMVAKAESYKELSGAEKFAIVLNWINEDLPKVFANSAFQAILKKLVQFAYNTSFTYMKNYIKRKTGQDVSEIIDTLKETLDDDTDSSSSSTTSTSTDSSTTTTSE